MAVMADISWCFRGERESLDRECAQNPNAARLMRGGSLSARDEDRRQTFSAASCGTALFEMGCVIQRPALMRGKGAVAGWCPNFKLWGLADTGHIAA
jgi:hypothetical protein